MSFLNALLRGLFDVLLLPFRGLPAVVGLTVISLITAVIALLIFKKTSDQEKLAAVKRRIHAGLFEIRLFNDDLRAIFRAQTEILRHNLRYIGLTLVPLLWMFIPLTLAYIHLDYHYGLGGLHPGDTSVLNVQLGEDWDELPAVASGGSPVKPAVSLEAPPGIRVETPAVWIPAKRELAWRIAAEEWGEYELTVKIGDEAYTKSAVVTQELRRLSPVRPSSGLLDQIEFPAEAPLPESGPLASIDLTYRTSDIPVLGLHLPWWIVWLALTMIFAFALRNVFGVTI